MEDLDLGIRTNEVGPTVQPLANFASIGSTCWSCHYSCDCSFTDTCGTCIRC